jgi:hypothetical protein
LILGVAITGTAPDSFARQDRDSSIVPQRFIEDTIYHMVIDLEENEFALWYGAWALVSCRFTLASDTSARSGFVERWRSPGSPTWRKVERRGVWSGRPAVSDTVISVVSEVSNADPDLIKRVYPDRFRVDLTGGFRFLVLTPDGTTQERGFAESLSDHAGRLLSFGRMESLTLVVSPDDAQTLYYALEPGTPIILGPVNSSR